MTLNGLFPSGAHIVGLPNNDNPRLLCMGSNGLKRWKESAFYPAYKPSAKAYRLLLRLKAALGIHAVRLTHPDRWLVREFVQDVFPKISSLAILVGTAGPTQKLIIQIWDGRSVIGYMKFARTPPARVRLGKEHKVLLALPKGVGPEVLRFGEMGSGDALLIAPVTGKPVSTHLPPRYVVWDFGRSLETSQIVSLDAHPWIQMLRLSYGASTDPWIDRLSHRKWPIAHQHGDLAPWNLFACSRNSLVAIDWEHGAIEGFPYVDIIHYFLQVSLLIYRHSPQGAKRLVMQYLSHQLKSLNSYDIEALVNLSVFSTFKQAEQDGHAEGSYYQTWRRAIWMDRIDAA
ncbi:MAG: hypothetical protein ABI618_01310 [Nitrospirota bacterium]